LFVVTFDKITDRETQAVLLKSLSVMTEGGDEFDDPTKKEVADTISSLVRRRLDLDVESGKRRRRDNENDDAGHNEENEEITIEEVSIDTIFKKNIMNSFKWFLLLFYT